MLGDEKGSFRKNKILRAVSLCDRRAAWWRGLVGDDAGGEAQSEGGVHDLGFRKSIRSDVEGVLHGTRGCVHLQMVALRNLSCTQGENRADNHFDVVGRG